MNTGSQERLSYGFVRKPFSSLEELSGNFSVREGTAAIAKDIVDDIVEAIATEGESLIGDRQPLVEVGLRDGQILSKAVVERNRDIEGLVSVGIEVGAFVGGHIRHSGGVGVRDVGDL